MARNRSGSDGKHRQDRFALDLFNAGLTSSIVSTPQSDQRQLTWSQMASDHASLPRSNGPYYSSKPEKLPFTTLNQDIPGFELDPAPTAAYDVDHSTVKLTPYPFERFNVDPEVVPSKSTKSSSSSRSASTDFFRDPSVASSLLKHPKPSASLFERGESSSPFSEPSQLGSPFTETPQLQNLSLTDSSPALHSWGPDMPQIPRIFPDLPSTPATTTSKWTAFSGTGVSGSSASRSSLQTTPTSLMRSSNRYTLPLDSGSSILPSPVSPIASDSDQTLSAPSPSSFRNSPPRLGPGAGSDTFPSIPFGGLGSVKPRRRQRAQSNLGPTSPTSSLILPQTEAEWNFGQERGFRSESSANLGDPNLDRGSYTSSASRNQHSDRATRASASGWTANRYIPKSLGVKQHHPRSEMSERKQKMYGI